MANKKVQCDLRICPSKGVVCFQEKKKKPIKFSCIDWDRECNGREEIILSSFSVFLLNWKKQGVNATWLLIWDRVASTAAQTVFYPVPTVHGSSYTAIIHTFLADICALMDVLVVHIN